MTDAREVIGGLATVAVPIGDAPRAIVVVLHGYAMRPEDLVPFARSMGVAARFYFPEGPVEAVAGGRAWWPIDQERRARALESGPRDLFEEHPEGADAARRLLAALVAALVARHAALPIALVGFSQGGMLAADFVLRSDARIDGLALLSSSRISADEWAPVAARLRALPVLVSHGERDPDLAFGAGERLRDFCAAAGASVSWMPFPGGHEIPLPVWRGVRRFLDALNRREGPPGPSA